jgi:hypothetical protein
MRVRYFNVFSLFFLLPGALSCGGGSGDGGGGPNPPPPLVPTTLEITTGNNQTGEVGVALPLNPGVRVKDQNGDALSGIAVTFTVTIGGGSVTGGAKTTDAAGIASVDSWTLGTVAGSNRISASVEGLTAVHFQASAAPGAPDTLFRHQGDGQNVAAGVSLPIAPAVKVQDQFGNGIPGVQVAFAGSSGIVTPATAVTNPIGLATVTWVVGGQLGNNTLSASVSGLPPVVFNANVVPGNPSSISKTAGDNQTGPAGVRFPIDLTILVSDSFGNGIPGYRAQVISRTGGGQVFEDSALTGDDGLAKIGWAPAVIGTNTISLRIGGVDLIFSATTQLGPAATLEAVNPDLFGTVGGPVLQPVGVRARDLGGNPVPSVGVIFTPFAGSGSVIGGAGQTDNNGEFVIGGWTLGTQSGVDSLMVTSQGLPSLRMIAGANPGVTAAVEKIAGDNQSAPVSEPSPTVSFRTVDQFGNPVPGIVVVYTVTSGGGSHNQGSGVTGNSGVGFTQWNLGPVPGANTLEVKVQGTAISTVFTMSGLPKPGSISRVAGDSQTGVVAQPLGVDPTVLIRDTQGQPLPGVPVFFTNIFGGGSVDRSVDTTDANGLASVQWTVSTVSGLHTLQAVSAFLLPTHFSATAVADAPTSVQLVAGDGQTQVIGSAVSIKPAVLVRDQFSNPVTGHNVDFTITAGSGSVTGGSASTGPNGVAQVGNWFLGSVGPNSLEAVVSGTGVGGNPVTFNATGLAANYDVDVRAISSLTANQQAAFDSAEARLERLVVGDIPDFPINLPATACGINHPAVFETVDDVIVFAQVVAIDGPGGILGSAGPCVFRTTSHMTIVGIMNFDAADLPSIEGQGLLDEVILHEMQHVLGLGSLWLQRGLLSGAGGADPFFNGAATLAAFNAIGGQGYSGPKVPVENQGGPGTRDGHWRESVFDNELMTGFLNSGNNPLSVVTVRSFQDYGYQVNAGAADQFVVGPFPAPPARTSRTLRLANDIWKGPLFEGNPGGTLLPVTRP